MPDKERLFLSHRLPNELEGVLVDLVIERLHPLGRERTIIADLPAVQVG